jgi:hypothetical protein
VHPHKGPSESDAHVADPAWTEGFIGELGFPRRQAGEDGAIKAAKGAPREAIRPPVKWFEATAALSRLSTARAALLWHLLRMQTKLDGQVWIVPRLSFWRRRGSTTTRLAAKR